MGSDERALAKVSELERGIAHVSTPAEANLLRRQVAAVQTLIGKRKAEYPVAFDAATAYLKVSRKAGEMWDGMENRRGRGQQMARNGHLVSAEDAGFAHHQDASRCVELAGLDSEDLRTYLDDCRSRFDLPTLGGALAIKRVVNDGAAFIEERPSGPAKTMAVHYSSASDEWTTPPEIVARVVKVLGDIDLDPCSNEGEPNIPAKRHFKEEHDGLSRRWDGIVYMNPPYGDAIDGWVDKLIAEHRSGRVAEAIALVPARTDTRWFRKFRDQAICFVNGRLRFSGKDPAPFPSAVVYLGADVRKFARHFSDSGDVWVRWCEDRAA